MHQDWKQNWNEIHQKSPKYNIILLINTGPGLIKDGYRLYIYIWFVILFQIQCWTNYYKDVSWSSMAYEKSYAYWGYAFGCNAINITVTRLDTGQLGKAYVTHRDSVNELE